MRFRPHEGSVHQVDLREALEPFEAERQQLPRLKDTGHPVGRGLEIPGEREEEMVGEGDVEEGEGEGVER